MPIDLAGTDVSNSFATYDHVSSYKVNGDTVDFKIEVYEDDNLGSSFPIGAYNIQSSLRKINGVLPPVLTRVSPGGNKYVGAINSDGTITSTANVLGGFNILLNVIVSAGQSNKQQLLFSVPAFVTN